MKKLLALCLCFTALTSVACSGDSRPITMDQLPAPARQFILAHFVEMPVAYVSEDPDLFDMNYNVAFTNGDKVEFRKNGTWSEVECTHSVVPMAVIPMPISEQLLKNYPAAVVKKIEQGKHGYELTLDNRLELKFDKEYRMVKIDD
ncbi:MAG: PepSY-like domain-containing protein [Alistipes sp.]